LYTSLEELKKINAIHILWVNLFLEFYLVMAYFDFDDFVGIFLADNVIDFIVDALQISKYVLMFFPTETVHERVDVQKTESG
jgi:hypothetical protein